MLKEDTKHTEYMLYSVLRYLLSTVYCPWLLFNVMCRMNTWMPHSCSSSILEIISIFVCWSYWWMCIPIVPPWTSRMSFPLVMPSSIDERTYNDYARTLEFSKRSSLPFFHYLYIFILCRIVCSIQPYKKEMMSRISIRFWRNLSTSSRFTLPPAFFIACISPSTDLWRKKISPIAMF